MAYTEMHPREHHPDYDGLISDETESVQAAVFNWIRRGLKPRKTPLDLPTSYGLKHVLERQTDIYLTNNAFKDAMLICGYQPADYSELNWRFGVSLRSLALKTDDGRYHDEPPDWLRS